MLFPPLLCQRAGDIGITANHPINRPAGVKTQVKKKLVRSAGALPPVRCRGTWQQFLDDGKGRVLSRRRPGSSGRLETFAAFALEGARLSASQFAYPLPRMARNTPPDVGWPMEEPGAVFPSRHLCGLSGESERSGKRCAAGPFAVSPDPANNPRPSGLRLGIRAVAGDCPARSAGQCLKGLARQPSCPSGRPGFMEQGRSAARVLRFGSE